MCSVTLRNLLFTSTFLMFWPSGIFLEWNAKNVPESNKRLSFGGPWLSWWGVSPIRCALCVPHPLAQRICTPFLLWLPLQHMPALGSSVHTQPLPQINTDSVKLVVKALVSLKMLAWFYFLNSSSGILDWICLHFCLGCREFENHNEYSVMMSVFLFCQSKEPWLWRTVLVS